MVDYSEESDYKFTSLSAALHEPENTPRQFRVRRAAVLFDQCSSTSSGMPWIVYSSTTS